MKSYKIEDLVKRTMVKFAVTPEQSIEIQKLFFKNGGSWYYYYYYYYEYLFTTVMNVKAEFLNITYLNLRKLKL